ncbi:TonB-dependent receptor [Gemmatimonas phototrophica]|nr:carboxypeptidase-like regulatory domain-containing protein [Gemmatimonas phototrophica]
MARPVGHVPTHARAWPLAIGLCAAVAWAAPRPVAAQQQTPPPASTVGRQADSTRALTMALLDVTVVEALERLSGAARMSIVWQPASLGARASTRISCRIDREMPEVLLRCITRAADLDYYRLSSGTYVVIAAAEAPPGWAALGGFVVDAATGAGLPSARVQLAELPNAVFAGDDGAFTMARLRPGTYAVTVRALGYQPLATTLEVTPNATRRVRLLLTRQELAARPIIVNGIRPGDASARLGAATIADSATRMLVGPSLFLPGAVAPLGVSRRDGTGDLHVQGGDIGEHPWRLDGIPLYDVTTLTGLLGIVSPLAVERVTVHRAGYGASVGSFTSGAIDLTHSLGEPLSPSAQTASRGVATDIAIDPLTATARLSTPVAVGNATGRAMLAARTGLWQFTAPPAMVRAVRHWSAPDPVLLARVSGFGAVPGMEQLDRTPYTGSAGDQAVSLNDVHLAVALDWGTAHQLSASAFTTAQGIAHDGTASDSGRATVHSVDEYGWRTAGAQLTHRWLLGTRVRQRVQLRASRHALDHDVSMAMASTPLAIAGGEHNAISEMSLVADWRVQLLPQTTATFGAEVSRAQAELDIANRVLRPLSFANTVWRGTLMADVTTRVAATTFLDAGVRVSQLQSGRSYAEPRLALRRESAAAGVPWSWRLSAGGYHQFVTQFDVASTMPVAFVPSVRFWLPTDGTTPVAQAWHVAQEAVWRPAPGWEVRGEGYAKWMPSIPTFDYGVLYAAEGVPASPSLVRAAQFVQRANGRAVGGGVRVIRDARLSRGHWRHELAYDYGWAERAFPSRFGGQQQPPSWLEPHRVLAVSEVTPWAPLTAAIRARGVMGRPWALRQVYYDLFGAAPDRSGLPIDLPGRMTRPAIVDLDMGATWRQRVGTATVEVGVSVTNVLNRANVLDYGLRRRADGSGYDMIARLLPGRIPVVTMQLRR